MFVSTDEVCGDTLQPVIISSLIFGSPSNACQVLVCADMSCRWVCTGAVTLEQAHMQPQSGPAGLQRAPAAEQQLWAYLTQLAAVLRAVHAAGCAVGGSGLAPSKVLLTSRVTARIKIGAAQWSCVPSCAPA